MIPAKVMAANKFVAMMRGAEHFEAPMRDAMSDREEAAYNAALSVMTLYFLGEQDFKDTGEQPDDDEPPEDEPEKVCA